MWLASFATFVLFYVLLCELYIVYRPLSPKIHILLAFVGLLHAILPLILAGIFSSSAIAVLSPFGFFGVLCGDADQELLINLLWLVNLLISLIWVPEPQFPFLSKEACS